MLFYPFFFYRMSFLQQQAPLREGRLGLCEKARKEQPALLRADHHQSRICHGTKVSLRAFEYVGLYIGGDLLRDPFCTTLSALLWR